MDIRAARESLRVLEDAATNATGPVRVAILASVGVAKAAIDECEESQKSAADFYLDTREQFDALEKVAEDAIEKASVAENALASYRAQQHKRAITKAQDDAAATEKAAIMKSISALGEQLKSVTPILATMMAARQYCKRLDNGQNIIGDQRPYGHIKCAFPDGEETIVEKRAHALLLAEAWTKRYIDTVKWGPGVNVSVKEDHPATQANGAAAVWPPPADQDGYSPERRLFGPGSPRIVDDE